VGAFFVEDLTEEPETDDDELKRFLKSEPHPLIQKYFERGLTLEKFCPLITEYDPLEYWNVKGKHRYLYPKIFQMSLKVLAYCSSSAFQESVFSRAAAVLGKDRSRMAPELLEASVLMNVILARDHNEEDDDSDSDEEN
jgi:hypothetical protein